MRRWPKAAPWLSLAILLAGAAGAGEPGAEAESPPGRSCAPAPLEVAPANDALREALHYFTRGRLLMAEGEPALAARDLARAARLAPGVTRIHQYLGASLYDAGDVRASAGALDEALRLDPENAFTLYLRGRAARAMNDFRAAVASFEKTLAAAPADSPHHILARYYLARTRQESGDVDGAIEHYKALLDELAEPRPFFRRYAEINLLYQGRPQIVQVLGRLHLLRGDNDAAIARFQEALAARPNETDLMGLLSRACIQKRDFAAARLWARRLIQANPASEGGYQRLVEAYRAEGRLDEAVADLERLRADDPRNRAVAFQLAAAYQETGRKDLAETLYGELASEPAAAGSTAGAAALKLADLRLAEGRPLDALQALASALTGRAAEGALLVRAAQIIDALQDPETVYRDARAALRDDDPYGTCLLVGMLAERLEKKDEAVALYDRALARQPKAALAYSRKADLLIQQNRLEDALGVYRTAVEAGLSLPVFHRKMGMILDRLGRLDEAVLEYRLARDGDPDDKPTRYFLVSALARSRKFDEAEAELGSLLERHPAEGQAYCQLASVALAQGDLAKAEQAVDQALALEPDSPAARELLGEVRFRQKRHPEAERIARDILASRPEAHGARLLLAYVLAGQNRVGEAVAEVRTLLAAEPENITWRYLLAGLYSEMDDRPSAERELARILQLVPDHAPSNNDLGYMWADRGVLLDRAEQLIRLALKSDPKSPAYLDSLAWVYYKRGGFEEAMRMLRAAADAAPKLDPVIWDHLGDAYWRLSRTGEAADAWQKAAQLLEGHPEHPRSNDLARLRAKVESVRAGAAPEVAPLAGDDGLEDDPEPGTPDASGAARP